MKVIFELFSLQFLDELYCTLSINTRISDKYQSSTTIKRFPLLFLLCSAKVQQVIELFSPIEMKHRPENDSRCPFSIYSVKLFFLSLN